jgi:hypothetical protein
MQSVETVMNMLVTYYTQANEESDEDWQMIDTVNQDIWKQSFPIEDVDTIKAIYKHYGFDIKYEVTYDDIDYEDFLTYCNSEEEKRETIKEALSNYEDDLNYFYINKFYFILSNKNDTYHYLFDCFEDL